jgi:hypothetical protein
MDVPRQSASALIAPKMAPLTLSDLTGFTLSIALATLLSDLRRNNDAAATSGAV